MASSRDIQGRWLMLGRSTMGRVLPRLVLSSLFMAGCQAFTRDVPMVPQVQAEGPLLCPPALFLPFRLRIDPAVSPPVWGEWQADGSRFGILWPPGFSLRVAGAPALLDPDGVVVGQNGEVIADAGGSGSDPATVCSIKGTTYDLT
jgi:hypothetical protein